MIGAGTLYISSIESGKPDKNTGAAARLVCIGCGAKADAACNRPYVPAGQRAAEAVNQEDGGAGGARLVAGGLHHGDRQPAAADRNVDGITQIELTQHRRGTDRWELRAGDVAVQLTTNELLRQPNRINKKILTAYAYGSLQRRFCLVPTGRAWRPFLDTLLSRLRVSKVLDRVFIAAMETFDPAIDRQEWHNRIRIQDPLMELSYSELEMALQMI
jgi:hypothetical protein